MTPAQVVEIARSWRGAPFHHQGRSRHGVDCAGLAVCVMREAGVLPPDFDARTNYGRAPQGELLAEVQRYCIATTTPEPGALVLIRWPRQEAPGHVAILATDAKGRATIIHAYQQIGAVVENGFRSSWARDAHSFWRLPGVTYV